MRPANASSPAPYVSVGAAISYAAVTAIDELARMRGMSRSDVLRAVIDRGLTETMTGEPELFARHLSIPPAPPRKRRRPRVFTFDAVGGARPVAESSS
jgi:hypothetical protein